MNENPPLLKGHIEENKYVKYEKISQRNILPQLLNDTPNIIATGISNLRNILYTILETNIKLTPKFKIYTIGYNTLTSIPFVVLNIALSSEQNGYQKATIVVLSNQVVMFGFSIIIINSMIKKIPLAIVIIISTLISTLISYCSENIISNIYDKIESKVEEANKQLEIEVAKYMVKYNNSNPNTIEKDGTLDDLIEKAKNKERFSIDDFINSTMDKYKYLENEIKKSEKYNKQFSTLNFKNYSYLENDFLNHEMLKTPIWFNHLQNTNRIEKIFTQNFNFKEENIEKELEKSSHLTFIHELNNQVNKNNLSKTNFEPEENLIIKTNKKEIEVNNQRKNKNRVEVVFKKVNIIDRCDEKFFNEFIKYFRDEIIEASLGRDISSSY